MTSGVRFESQNGDQMIVPDKILDVIKLRTELSTAFNNAQQQIALLQQRVAILRREKADLQIQVDILRAQLHCPVA